MELKQVDSLSYKLNVKQSFAIEQSDDDFIGILFENGVYIFHLFRQLDSTPTISYNKHFIPNPGYTIGLNFDIDLGEILHKLSKDEIYTCILHSELFSSLEYSRSKPPHLNMIKWSPLCAIGNQNLLSVLNNTGGLEVFVKIVSSNGFIEYKSIANITSLHIDAFKSRWVDLIDKSPRNLFGEFLRRLDLHLPTAMVWSHLCMDGPIQYCVLIVAHLGGQLSFWRLNHVNLDEFSKAQFYLLGEQILDVKEMCAMHWVPMGPNSGLLLCGTKSGQMIGLPVKDTKKYNFKCLDSIFFHRSEDLEISCIDSFRFEDVFFIYSIQKSVIFIHALSSQGKIVDSASYDGGNLSITSVQKTKDTLLILFITGIMKELKITLVKEKLQISSRNFFVNANWSRKKAISFCLSKNLSIFTMILQNCTHCLKRDVKQTKIINYVNNSQNYVDILLENPKNLRNFQDCLEALRIISLQTKEPPFKKLPAQINYDNLSLQQLKIHYYISKFSELVSEKLSEIPITSHKSSNELSTMIGVKLAVNAINRITLEPTEFDRQCLHFCGTFLKEIVAQEFLVDHNLNNYVEEIFDALLKCRKINAPQIDCMVCDNLLVSSTCLNEHSDNRCALTLTQIATNHPKYKCGCCKRYVSQMALGLTKCVLCPYCDCILDAIIS